MATIVVKQIGSPIRRPKEQRATLKGLGLSKMHRTRELIVNAFENFRIGELTVIPSRL